MLKRTKYKVCYQNRINLWDRKKLTKFKLKFHNKKWGWLNSKKKKTIFNSLFFIKHRRSARFLYKSLLRLRSLLRYSRSLMKQRQLFSLFFKYKRKSPKFILFLNKLNSRLDFVIYNSNFVNSVFHIRQLISHGFVVVNGAKCTNPGFFLHLGDIVSFTPEFKLYIYKSIVQKGYIRKPLSSSLEINYNTLASMFFYTDFSSVPYTIEDKTDLGVLNFISLK